jgi:hypothetical protein
MADDDYGKTFQATTTYGSASCALGTDHYRHVGFSAAYDTEIRLLAIQQLAVDEFVEVSHQHEVPGIHRFCCEWRRRKDAYFKRGVMSFSPGCWWERRGSNQKAMARLFGMCEGPMRHMLVQRYADWLSRFVDRWMEAWTIAHAKPAKGPNVLQKIAGRVRQRRSEEEENDERTRIALYHIRPWLRRMGHAFNTPSQDSTDSDCE